MTSRHEHAALLHGKRPSRKADKYGRPPMQTWHTQIGLLTHQCAAALADVRDESPLFVAQSATEWVNQHVRDNTILGNLAKARSQVTSLACAYLLRYAPGSDAQYLGAEIRLETERIDLAWFVPDLGIVIDELKTTAWVSLKVDAAMLAQPMRYRERGVKEWGDLFAGVRFLPLRNPHEAHFIAADGTVTSLADSVAAVLTKDAS